MFNKIKDIYNKINNRLKAKEENKLRLKYTSDDILNKILFIQNFLKYYHI